MFTGFETQNKYRILNSLGQQVYFAAEGILGKPFTYQDTFSSVCFSQLLYNVYCKIYLQHDVHAYCFCLAWILFIQCGISHCWITWARFLYLDVVYVMHDMSACNGHLDFLLPKVRQHGLKETRTGGSRVRYSDVFHK